MVGYKCSDCHKAALILFLVSGHLLPGSNGRLVVFCQKNLIFKLIPKLLFPFLCNFQATS